MGRYARTGRIYDVMSLEAPLYRRPRRRLLDMLGPMPGRTVVDVGCGTGLNFAGLRDLVDPGGVVVGIEPSASMRAAAHRRVGRRKWEDVIVLDGEADDVLGVLGAAGVDPDSVEAIVATFVLSLLGDDTQVWAAVDELAARRTLRIAVADLGSPTGAPLLVRPLLDLLVTLGGVDAARRPWEQLIGRDPGTRHETAHGGHVHLAVGTAR